MGKNKLQHFEENKSFPHFFQPVFEEFKDGYELQGKWNKGFFQNDHPFVLELGCGKGEYTVGMARKYPGKNFLGVDIKGARMWRGAKTSDEEGLSNVAFLRMKIEQLIFCFGKHELDEIWITFPDPVPKIRQTRKRLTSPNFLRMYHQLLKPEGIIHVKTDSKEFYEYSLEYLSKWNFKLLYETSDLYQSGFEGDASEIQTYYEKKYLKDGTRIKYLQFKNRV